MSFLKRTKKTEKTTTQSARILGELEQICGDDKEIFEALQNVMFLDPRKVQTTIKDALENAKKLEREKNLSRARIWYDIAGGLAIYEGSPKKVVEYFSEAERLSSKKYPILKIPEKAVAKAQEYYKKYLQT